MSGPSVLRRVAAAIYSLAAIVVILRAGQPDDAGWWLSGVLFGVWIASPVVAALWSAKFVKGIAHYLYLALIAAIAGYGFYVQWRVMFIDPPDAQSALILLFVPLYQWIAAVVSFGFAWLAGRYVFDS